MPTRAGMLVFLNSNFGVVVAGFLFTGLIGVLLNSCVQDSTWKRQEKHDRLVHDLDEKARLSDDISNLIARRFFRMQRVVYALKNPSPDLKNVWENYFNTVIEWNEKVKTMRTKLRIYADNNIAYLLNNPNDDLQNGKVTSIHFLMSKLHADLLKSYRDTLKTMSPISTDQGAAFDQEILELDGKVDEFEDKMTRLLLQGNGQINGDSGGAVN